MNGKKLTSLEKSWILYDVGNSAFILLVSTIIPILFKNLASQEGVANAQSTVYYSYAASITTIIVAILGPIFGKMGDRHSTRKKHFIISFVAGAIACLCLSITNSYLVFLGIFILAKVAYSISLIHYDSMLMDVTDKDRMDEISSQGFAWGYIGSCIPFVISLMIILLSDKIGLTMNNAMKLSFIICGIWWIVSSIPLSRQYNQRCVNFEDTNIIEVLKEIKNNKKVLKFLIAFFFYIDGVYTIIEMATSYGKDVGIDDNSMLLALLLTQVIAFPFSLIFGKLSKKYKTDNLISIAVGAYFIIALFALSLDCAWKFWLLAICVAIFQGAVQALSRSYYARIIPQEKAGEYFGIYDIFGKGASFFGTMLMGIATHITGNSRVGVFMIALMIFIGFCIFNGGRIRESEKNKEVITDTTF